MQLIKTADVALLQDTRLKINQDLLKSNLPEYSAYEIKHADQAGIAIVIKNKINHQLITSISANKHSLLSIKLTDKRYFPHPLIISSLYVPPLNARHQRQGLDDALLDTSLSEKYAVTFGDLNARHVALGCRGTNLHGKTLLRYLTNSNNLILNDTRQPTFSHVGHTFIDTLDYIISTPAFTKFVENCLVGPDVGSDHLPLILTTKALTRSNQLNNQPVNLPAFNINLTDWPLFSTTLEQEVKNDNSLWPLTDEPDIELLNKQCENLARHFGTAIEKSTKRHRPKLNNKLRLPPHTLLLINSRRRLKQKHMHCPSDKLRREINELNRAINNDIKLIKLEVDTRRSAVLKQGPKHPKFWPVTKSLLKPFTTQSYPLIHNNDYVGEPDQKLELFKKLYSEILLDDNTQMPHTEAQDKINNNINKLSFEPYQPSHPILQPITLDELAWIVSETKNNKAPGPDNIRYENIKRAPLMVVKILLNIYNNCLLKSHFPPHFKNGIVALILKPGKDPTQTTSYRPITLTSTLGKTFEKILHARLIKHALKYNLIKTHQTAFLPKRGTEDNILRLLQAITNNYNNNRYTLLVSTDLKQAFDRTWHNGLLNIMVPALPNNFTLLIRSFLINRKLKFKIDNNISSWTLSPNRGMPQGSPLSPLLFNIFMSVAPAVNTHTLGTFNYADDTFFTSSALSPKFAWEHVSRHINNFTNWCKSVRLLIQPDKTRLQYFTRRRRTPNEDYPLIKINNNIIPRSTQIKVLGITLDTHLTLQKHIKNITNETCALINPIRRMMNLDKRIPPFIALLLYKTLIRSKFCYGAPVLNLIKPTTWRAMQYLEHRALRAAFRVGIRTKLEHLYKKSKMEPLNKYYEKISQNTINRIINNRNKQLINTMFITKPIANKTFTCPPLDRAFDLLPIADRTKQAEVITTIINETVDRGSLPND